jgi:hypothetical protein
MRCKEDERRLKEGVGMKERKLMEDECNVKDEERRKRIERKWSEMKEDVMSEMR